MRATRQPEKPRAGEASQAWRRRRVSRRRLNRDDASTWPESSRGRGDSAAWAPARSASGREVPSP